MPRTKKNNLLEVSENLPLVENEIGYVSPCEQFAAVPFGENKYIIIFNGKQIRTCKNIITAKNFINQERKKLK